MILCVADTAGIQSFVFGSNRLRENIGASWLIAQATESWAVGIANTIKTDATLYAGGGNYVGMFDTKPQASCFVHQLTRKALCEAPGLRVIVASVSYNPQGDYLGEKLKEAFTELGRLKAQQPHSTPLLGLSVTRACGSTGLPAVDKWKIKSDNYFASAEIMAKVGALDSAKDRLKKDFKSVLTSLDSSLGSFDFPDDFDDLGGTRDDQRYIAVVHADGDGMGRRLMEIRNKYKGPSENVNFIQAIRNFSEAVEKASLKALQTTLEHVCTFITWVDGQCVLKNREGAPVIPLARGEKHNERLLPLRPLVFGGDDLTLVCDGRLGVAIAAFYLEQFKIETEKCKEALGGQGLTASAGVAIVKTRFPFSRAYALAEELAKSAKTYRRKIDPDGKQSLCGLDWHIATSGLQRELSALRQHEYSLAPGQTGALIQRPALIGVPVGVPDPEAHSWKRIENNIFYFQEKGMEQRNKVKELREILRGGKDALDKFQALYPDVLDGKMTTWEADGCQLFDSIELSDYHFSLTREDENEAVP